MPSIQKAPITLFVYNRPWHTRQTVEALQKNELAADSDLIIFADGPKVGGQHADNRGHKTENRYKLSEVRAQTKDNSRQATVSSNQLSVASGESSDRGSRSTDYRLPITDYRVQQVREYIRTINGFKSVKIIERDTNLGLANSIISGVTEVVNQYGRIIVMEDDLVVSPYFLSFMNFSLDYFCNDERIISINAYAYPIKGLPNYFFLKGADCWGWATWKRGWDLFNPDGNYLLAQINKQNMRRRFDYDNSYPYFKSLKSQTMGRTDSWAIRWYASALTYGKLSLYTGKSYVRNIGMDSTGVHSDKTTLFDSDINMEAPIYDQIRDLTVEEDDRAYLMHVKYLQSIKISLLFAKLKHRINQNLRYVWNICNHS